VQKYKSKKKAKPKTHHDQWSSIAAELYKQKENKLIGFKQWISKSDIGSVSQKVLPNFLQLNTTALP
jgi:hypothetical protein